MTARLATIALAADADAWAAVGFAVDRSGAVVLANGAIELVGSASGGGLTELVVSGVASGSREPGADPQVVDVDGILVRVAADDPVGRGGVPEHPNGAFELDHVVVATDSLDRTSAAVADVLGLERRRVREVGTVRQAFHRFADEPTARGCILELVERPEVERAGLWGFVVNVADLDAAVALAGPDRIGEPRAAVQPGRRIASFRRGAELGAPIALMS